MINIGYSTLENGFDAGQEIIRSAMRGHSDRDISLVLAFCTKHLDKNQFLQGMFSQVPPGTPIVGGTTIGIISNDIISYNQATCSALVFFDNDIATHVAVAGLETGEVHAGAQIARNMGCRGNDKFLFLLYNMIKKERHHHTPPEMNSLRSILHGIQSINQSGVPIFGAGILGDFDFEPSSLFCSKGVRANCILGITFCGDFDIDYIVMHGCMPINGIYHTITKNEGPLILELDGRPAIEIVNDIYGSRDWQKEIPVKELTIGVNMGPKYGPYKESNYVNRLIASPDLLKKGILTPEPDWQPGTEIQFMIRDNEDMLKSTQLSVETLVEQNINAGKKPLLGFFIDCAGRTSYFSNSLHEEAELVQRVFNQHNVPLFGFYSGLEIAPFFNESRGLEWTGVLVLLVEK